MGLAKIEFPAVRVLAITVFTAIAVYFTPSSARAQQCIDIFNQGVAPGSNSSTDVRSNGDLLGAVTSMSPDAQFNLFVQVFDSIPAMRPFAARQMLRVAEKNLADNNVAYRKTITDKGGVLIITPSNATPLNQLARNLADNYGASLQINPYLILASHERAAFSAFAPGENQALVPTLNLAWKHIADIPHLQFWKDPEVINEMRHIQTFKDLAARKPYPLYGQIYVTGKVPGDPNPAVKSNSRFFYFDKIKIYHSYVKEELNVLKDLLTKGASRDEIESQRAKIASLIQELNILSSRTGLAAAAYFNPASPIYGDNEITDGHVVARINYDDGSGNKFSIRIPLVHSLSLYSPKNGPLIDRQMRWLFQTARNAVGQSGRAAKLFKTFTSDLPADQGLAILHEVQNSLPSAKLIPPEPES